MARFIIPAAACLTALAGLIIAAARFVRRHKRRLHDATPGTVS